MVFSNLTMHGLEAILPYIQIVVSFLLIGAVILQQRGAGVGGAFGGDNFASEFYVRRGGELWLFRATIILALLFVASALLSIVL